MKLFRENSSISINCVNKHNINKIAFIISKMFENSLNKPKILINIESNFLSLAQFLLNYANVKVVKNCLHGIFSFITHFEKFDLGIFCEKTKNGFSLKFYSGTGYILSPTMFSILESNLNNKNNDFKLIIKKIKVHNFSDKLDKFCCKCIKKYCAFYKRILKNKINVKVVCKNKTEQLLINIILGLPQKSAKFVFFINKDNIYCFKDNKKVDLVEHFNVFDKIENINEYDMFRCALEQNKQGFVTKNNFFVAKNAFTFDNISRLVFCINNLHLL